MSTIVVLAFGAALVAALGFVIDVLRRPRRGRHVSGAVPVVRAVAPVVPIAAAGAATLAIAPVGTVGLSAALVWCLSILALPLTGRFSACAHSAWSLMASGLVLALGWGAWRVASGELSGAGLVVGALLWVVVAVAVAAALAYGWEVVRAAEANAGLVGGAAPGWWRPRMAMTMVCLSGAAAAAGLVFLAPTAATPGSRPLAGPRSVPSAPAETPLAPPPSAVSTSPTTTVERAAQTAASRSSRTAPPVASSSATTSSTSTSTTPDRKRTRSRTGTSTTDEDSPSTTTTPILDVTITPDQTRPTKTKPPHNE